MSEINRPVPDDKEIETHASILALLARSSQAPPAISVTALQTAVGVLTYDRPLPNLLLQWEIDPHGLIDDGVRTFKRFVEVVGYLYEQADKNPDSSVGVTLRSIVPPNYVAALCKAVARDDLREAMFCEFERFVEYVKSEDFKEDNHG